MMTIVAEMGQRCRLSERFVPRTANLYCKTLEIIVWPTKLSLLLVANYGRKTVVDHLRSVANKHRLKHRSECGSL